jgi:arsenate reductase
MAAALLMARVGEKVEVVSAGTAPAQSINRQVVDVMLELGIDLLSQAATPKKLTESMVHDTDFVITMGCGDECPYIPGVEYLDWPLQDPAGQDVVVVRRIRDDIAVLVDQFIERLRQEGLITR